MKIFKNLEEIKQYYNGNTNTYEFVENKQLLDVELTFDLSVDSNIHACNIKAGDIKARDIIFNAVCFAYKTFVCKSIKGKRGNNKYFCLDSDVVIKGTEGQQ